MKLRYVAILAVIAFIFASSILPSFRIMGSLPNFCIIISVILLVLYSSKHAYTFAIIYGLLQDVFLGRLMNLNLFAYIIMLFVISKWIEILFKGNFLTPLFLMTASTSIYHVVQFIIAFFFQISLPFDVIVTRIIIEVILNSLIGLFIYSIIFKSVNGYKLGDYNA